MKVKLIFIFFIIIILSGCSKTKEIPKEVLLPSLVRDYFGCYDSSSTWVYTKQNDSTFLDTAYIPTFNPIVQSYDIGADGYCEKSGCRKEEISLMYSWGGKRMKGFILTLDKSNVIITDYQDYVLMAQLNNENEYYSESPMSAGHKAEILTEFEVNGKKYSKVLHLSSNVIKSKEIYVAPKVGIIQKKNLDGTTYILKSSNIKLR